jgi:hypothetical protein
MNELKHVIFFMNENITIQIDSFLPFLQYNHYNNNNAAVWVNITKNTFFKTIS